MTLLNIQVPPPVPEAPSVYDSTSRMRILVYVPLAVAVFLILLPHPSFLIMLTSHYLKILQSPAAFWTHLLAVYFLSLMVFSSLIVCVVRDPGRVMPMSSPKPGSAGDVEEDEVNVALLDEEDQAIDVDQMKGAGRWCRRCELRRPERAHHCSTCGRCVLKMDHHCPWLGGNCVGYRTYPSFLHFIFSATLLAAYITGVALSVMVHLISDPFSVDPRVTPLHSLFLIMMGAIFTLTMGSFTLYHVYLVSTNQTTLEHMSPFLLLRYLPGSPDPEHDTSDTSDTSSPLHASASWPHVQPPPPKLYYPPPPSSPRARPKVNTTLADPPTPPMNSSFTSPLSPPSTTHSYPLHPIPPHAPAPSSSREEHMLSPAQRRLTKHMHGRLRPYDVGFRANWAQVFGGGRRQWRQWAQLLLWGGAPPSDGCAFARGPGVQAQLERLARDLDDIRRRESRG